MTQASDTRRIVPAITLTLCVVLACLSNSQTTQADNSVIPGFQSVRTIYPGDYSTQTVVDDFNRDGKPDLVIVGPEGDLFKLFTGDGTGNFTEVVPDLNAYFGQFSVVSADFNLDGNPDVLVGGGSGRFEVIYGNGGGALTTRRWFESPESSPGYFYDIVVQDFNHDNQPDLAVAHQYALSIWLGDGGGGFLAPVEYLNDVGSFELATADLNGDGHADLISSNAGDAQNVSLLLGDGTGAFTPSSLPFAPGGGYGPFFHHGPIALGDFNHDSKIDLVLVNPDDVSVSLRLGNGAGGFGLPTMFPTGGNGHNDMRTADFNGDGKLDLVVTHFSTNDIAILLGDGAGGLDSPLSYPLNDTPYRLTIADLNLDSKPDIVTANFSVSTSVLINNTYQTPVGEDATVVVGQTSFTFDEVTAGGTTTVTPIDPATVGQVPGGFAVSDSVAYEIATTATFTGSVTLAFNVPGPISEEDFNGLAILHNENGTLIDVTASTPARDYSTRTIYATTASFSPFYLARRGPHIRTLFDQTKAYKHGSTVPIKLQMLNPLNANISSANTLLIARDLKFVSGNTLAPVADSGNANPDYTFRYDSTLGGAGGGYIFNLSTKGLSLGRYVLSFYVGSDRSFFYTVTFELK